MPVQKVALPITEDCTIHERKRKITEKNEKRKKSSKKASEAAPANAIKKNQRLCLETPSQQSPVKGGDVSS